MFEFADELINLPPLPFSFDMDLYDRVRSALAFVEAEVAVTEEAFLKKIKNFSPEERDRFMAFTEPFDNSLITLSPLAYCLVSVENKQGKPLIAPSVADDLKKIEGVPALKVKRLIRNSVNPIWRERHVENWQDTDLLVLKQINTSERIAGFLKNGKFCVTHVFANHEGYERTLGKYSKKDFNNVLFTEWDETEYLGTDTDDRDEVAAERDRLFLENKNLEIKIAAQKKTIDDKDLKILELSEKIDEMDNLLKERKVQEERVELIQEPTEHTTQPNEPKASPLRRLLDLITQKKRRN
jgi:hypothetical protein